MAEGFRFIYLAFLFCSAETLSLSAWVSLVQHERRCSCARGEDVSFRDVKMKITDRNMTGGWQRRHTPEASAEDFGDLRKVNFVEF